MPSLLTMAAAAVAGAAGVAALAAFALFKMKSVWGGPKSVKAKDMTGKVVVVTGCTPGSIGFSIVDTLACWGAHVVMGMRDPAKAEAARKLVEEHVKLAGSRGSVEVQQLDLMDMDSVRAFAARVADKFPAIDVLVLNAGIAVTSGKVTKQGHNDILGVNHYAHFLLLRLLEDKLVQSSKKTAEPPLVLFTSSMAHYAGRVKPEEQGSQKQGPGGVQAKWFRGLEWFTYADSKLLNALTARAFAARHPTNDVVFASCCPGFVRTNIWEGKESLTPLARLLDPFLALARTPEQGATRHLQIIAGEIPFKSGAYVDSYVDFPRFFTAPELRSEANLKWVWEDTSKIVGLAP